MRPGGRELARGLGGVVNHEWYSPDVIVGVGPVALWSSRPGEPTTPRVLAYGIAQVKFFTPWTTWTWFASKYDPENRSFFGVVVGHERELGY